MKNLLFIFFISTAICHSQQNNNSNIQPFLPNIITSFPNVRDFSMTSNKNEVYFSIQSYTEDLSAIVVIKNNNNAWSKPTIVSFSGQFHDIEPFLSPDGLQLYFASNRPLNSSEVKIKDFDIWYVKRKNLTSNWSKPINLGTPINTSSNEFYPAITNNKNLYFTSDYKTSKGKDDIFLSKFESGKYTKAISLSKNINSEGYEFNAFVSPDELFIIYTAYNRKDGFGSGDLYISYKNSDNTWSEAKNLGAKINSNKMDYCPFVDLTSGTLYFTSKRNNTKKTFLTKQPIKSILKEMTKYENGLSRLYKIKLVIF